MSGAKREKGVVGRTPLARACIEGDYQEASKLLQKGSNIDVKDKTLGKTPFIIACERGHESIVQLFVDMVLISSEPKAIHAAAKEGQKAIVELLFRAGVDINDNGDGECPTPLMLASQHGHVDVVDCLLSLGADTELRCPIGKTALMVAILNEKIDVVDRLLEAECDVHAEDVLGFTALIWAARMGCVPIIDRLVVHGADFHHQNNRGENALMWASREGHTEAVDRLLSLGCDVNVQARDGWCALAMACSEERVEIARLLLDHGADPLICNKDGERAIDLAARSPEIQTLLNGLILLSFHHHHRRAP